jgi:chaperonin GroES
MKAKKKLMVVGPRVLISPDRSEGKTDAGLYLPPTVKEKEEVQGGTVVKTGPGYPLPDMVAMSEEPWAKGGAEAKYIPLQAQEGDYALFLKKDAVEIEFEGDKFLIVPHSSILALARTEIVEE